MKKIVYLFLVFSCLFSFQAYADSVSPSFRYDLTFNSTLEDIIKAEGMDPTYNILNYVLYEGMQTAGMDSQVFYTMDDDGTISMCAIYIEEKHTEEQLHVFDYNKIDELLIEKYGVPSNPKEITYFDDLFKNNPDKLGLAICCGDALVTTRWTLDGLYIVHGLSGDNYEFSHLITYTSVPLEEQNLRSSSKGSGL